MYRLTHYSFKINVTAGGCSLEKPFVLDFLITWPTPKQHFDCNAIVLI